MSASLANTVTAELAAVRRIYDEHAVKGREGTLVGFRELHVRTQPEAPLIPPVPQATLRQMLPARHTYAGVGLGASGIALDSFAFAAGPIDVYGLAVDDLVAVLGVRIDTSPSTVGDDIPAGLAGIMRRFALMLVDWCRCAAIDADSLGAYYQAIS